MLERHIVQIRSHFLLDVLVPRQPADCGRGRGGWWAADQRLSPPPQPHFHSTPTLLCWGAGGVDLLEIETVELCPIVIPTDLESINQFVCQADGRQGSAAESLLLNQH